MSAEKRSVHVWTVTTAPHGTPATSELRTAPPPYEMPQAPMLFPSTSGRSASHWKTARVSAISRGPSMPTSPPDWPCPRASKASTAYPRATNPKLVTSAFMLSRLPARACRKTSAGQPSAGGAPSGR